MGTTEAQRVLVNRPNLIANWNDLWQSGFYDSDNAANSPEPSQWFWGVNLGHRSNSSTYRYGGQIAIRSSNTLPVMYFRNTNVNGVGTWARILHNVGTQKINGGLEITDPHEASIKITGSSSELGGRLILENTTKNNPYQATRWHIFNMTGAYGNALQFWAYNDYSCGSGGISNNPMLILNDDGNVGIGRAPSYKLDVNGTIRVNATIYPSDERLKSNIKPLFEEKDRLYLLQGKSYKKTLPPTGFEELSSEKKKNEEFPEYGFLAQELKEVFPDLVFQDSAGYYSVNYVGLIPIIVEALKAQRLEIEKQHEQIKQLVKLMDIKSINEDVFRESGIESIPLLLQNTPNPFNEVTEIGYFIPETVKKADIYIYDINGFQQRNISIFERGKGVTTLQASALRAGIYFYTLICDGKPVDTKQMILTR